jgi:branched-chain amino acid transport system substrate-binding protein
MRSKTVRDVCNLPGEETDDVVKALEMVRAGKKIEFVGAGARCDFDENGDQINRSFLHQLIQGGKNQIVGMVSWAKCVTPCFCFSRLAATRRAR